MRNNLMHPFKQYRLSLPNSVDVQIKFVDPDPARHPPYPEYKSSGAAGMDLYAAIDRPVVIYPNHHKMILTGIAIAIPEMYEGQIRGRSGLAIDKHVMVLHGVATIDSDYRGELMVPLVNWGEKGYEVNPLDRVAQLIVAPVSRVSWHPVTEFGFTKRGEQGFGSTGKSG